MTKLIRLTDEQYTLLQAVVTNAYQDARTLDDAVSLVGAVKRATEPPREPVLEKLRELADSQHELDPQARNVLYSRMRELYVQVNRQAEPPRRIEPSAALCPFCDGTRKLKQMHATGNGGWLAPGSTCVCVTENRSGDPK